MSARPSGRPKVGCHVRWKDQASIGPYRSVLLAASPDDTYEVTSIQPYPGQRAVFCKVPGKPEPFAIWNKHLKALPRCAVCDQEGHTGRETKKCPDQKDQAEARRGA